MQQFVCLPYQLMRSAAGVIVVLAQLQNHCRSRETCSFGTPDAVVCKAARSASAALAAVGESVGIAERAGAASLLLLLLPRFPKRDAARSWLALALPDQARHGSTLRHLRRDGSGRCSSCSCSLGSAPDIGARQFYESPIGLAISI